jgi:hypothetical protein
MLLKNAAAGRKPLSPQSYPDPPGSTRRGLTLRKPPPLPDLSLTRWTLFELFAMVTLAGGARCVPPPDKRTSASVFSLLRSPCELRPVEGDPCFLTVAEAAAPL